MVQVELRGITKTFGDTPVLRGVDLSVSEGEFITLVGPSGCGKSTLLRILAGLEAANAGQVLIGGQDMTRVRPAQRNLAMVFQSYALYPHLTVAENMMTPLKLRDLSWRARLPFVGPMAARRHYTALRNQVRQTADVLKIQPLLDRKPGQLSGGQRQRAALGRALVRNPVAFLMDEPLSNLDAALRVHMRAELAELHRRLGTTFIYVTHDQAEALTMSDRMAVMQGGDILQFAPPEEIYNAPETIEVARFIGSPPINLCPGEVSPSGRLTLFGQVLGQINAPHGPVQIGLRAEAVSLSPHGPEARIVHRENLGSDLYLHALLVDNDQRITLRAAPGTQAAIGQSIHLSWEASKALVFGADGRRIPGHLTAPKELVV